MELTQEEKELIIVSLGNSLVDPEQDTIESDVAKLYDKLVDEWATTTYHSSQEIIHIKADESKKLNVS